jgi:hypothetical protein
MICEFNLDLKQKSVDNCYWMTWHANLKLESMENVMNNWFRTGNTNLNMTSYLKWLWDHGELDSDRWWSRKIHSITADSLETIEVHLLFCSVLIRSRGSHGIVVWKSCTSVHWKTDVSYIHNRASSIPRGKELG